MRTTVACYDFTSLSMEQRAQVLAKFYSLYYDTEQSALKFGEEFYYLTNDILSGNMPGNLNHLEDWQESISAILPQPLASYARHGLEDTSSPAPRYKVVQIYLDVKMAVDANPAEVHDTIRSLIAERGLEDMSGYNDYIDATEAYRDYID